MRPEAERWFSFARDDLRMARLADALSAVVLPG